MSDNWIRYVAGKIRNEASALPHGLARDQKMAIVNMLTNNQSLIKKYLTVVNKSAGDILICLNNSDFLSLSNNKSVMAYSIVLTANEISDLKRLRRSEKDGKLLRRYQCIWMCHENFPKKEIASTLGINIDTVTDWIKLFNNKGLDGLGKLHYEGRRPSSLDAVKDALIKHIKEQSVSKLSELQDFLEKKYSIKVEHSWLSRYCKKNSIALIKRQG